MALVGYSDSEESDSESPQIAAPVAPKRLERTEGKKIRVDLSSLQPENSEQVSEPATKRQRTGGAFSGFNSLLPAPKRTAQNALKPGLSLRTSSEAAFSRVPPPTLESSKPLEEADDAPVTTNDPAARKVEPMLLGKTTRFMPLSVANAKKKKRPPAAVPAVVGKSTAQPEGRTPEVPEPSASQPKPKQSLFSMVTDENDRVGTSAEPYEPEFVQSNSHRQAALAGSTVQTQASSSQGNALKTVAMDLNLSASERRRLFGRHGNSTDVKISHFDMDSEYRSNQDLAASGEATEQRTVRAIAPGKHSLQQLVNNVKGQTEAIEDKWAEGRRNRGEAGSKYGW